MSRFVLAMLAATLAPGAPGAMPAQSSRGSAEIALNGAAMTVEYGRASLSGRDALAEAPVGTVWRLGADEATTLRVNGAAVFGNMVIQEGEYSLFVERIAEDRWSLVVNAQTGQMVTEHDRSKDILGIPLKWEQQEDATETLLIELLPETADTGILSIRFGRGSLKQRFRLVAPR